MGRNMRNFTMTKSISSIVAMVMLLGITNTTVIAQGSIAIEEITVTARQREESIADAPYTISAITAEQIQARGINQLSDVVAYSPGFFFSDNNVGKNSRSHKRLIFRGMNPRTDIPTRQASAMFIDGAATVGAEFGSMDGIERIEVLRGPQGAHFGRSTYTGAINIVTSDPGDEFSGRVNIDAAQHGTQRTGVVLDGPLGESLGYRLSVSSYETDGMYDNYNVPGQKLGAQSTDDTALTLVFNPSDKFKVKLRYHTWEDSDGPDAGTAYDYRSGTHNCSPGGLVERWDPVQVQASAAYNFNPATNVPHTTICGKVPVPSSIGQDTGSPRALALLQNRIDGSRFPIANGLRPVPDFMVPDHFGLEREAEELSIVVDVNFDNGMNLNIVSAQHENAYSTHNDTDRRVTEGLHLIGQGGGVFGGFGANHPADASDLRMNSMEDDSIEFRLSSSDDQSVRWMVGYSQLDMEWFTQVVGNLIVYYPSDEDNAARSAAGDMPVCYNPYWPFYGAGLAGSNACGAYGDTTSNNNDMKWDSIDNSAFYASIEADITDNLTVSVDVRRQDDDITSGGVGAYTGGTPKTLGAATAGQNGEFSRTLPRIILDYKPNEDTTMYFSYSEGSLPGTFNPSLATLTASQQAEIAVQTGGATVEVDEEVSENLEFGIKRTILDGRGFVAVAIYDTDLTNVHTPFFSPTYTDADGNQALLSGNITSQGGEASLNGIEIDGTVILNELWSLDFTYAINDSEIGNGFQSADTFDLDGDRNKVLGNMFSRYPKNSGSLSANYSKEVSADREMFARMDFIYTGNMYASNAMHAYTGSGSKINLRGGFDTDNYRVEAYVTNLFDDNQPKGLQQLYDLSGITGGFGDGAVTAGGMRIVSIALADKRTIGVRASYKF